MSTLAKRISDQNNIIMSNFPIIVSGSTISEDYLSILTTNYNDSPYIVRVTLTVIRPD